MCLHETTVQGQLDPLGLAHTQGHQLDPHTALWNLRPETPSDSPTPPQSTH